jgi:hypothetical protein
MIDLFWTEVRDAAGLRDSIRARIEQLNISRECVDRISGLASGYSAKILSQGEAKNPKHIGTLSLDLLLPAVGLKLIVCDDREALAKMARMYVERDASQVRTDNHWRNKVRNGAVVAAPKPKSCPRRAKKPPTRKGGKPYLHELVAGLAKARSPRRPAS